MREKVGQEAEWPSPSAEEALPPVVSKDSPFSLLVFTDLNAVDFGLFPEPTRTEAAFILPRHTTETEELKPQLKLLLSHFNIPYDVEGLRDAAKDTELLFLVLDGLFLNTNMCVHERKH